MSVANWLGIIAGVSLFIYGIRMMGEGIERMAGAKLKSILEALTKNRFLGLLVGFCVTAIIQSSNATSAMTVGFVNAGMMPLGNAICVIMGANIGTTVTGFLLALKVDEYAAILALVGVFGTMFIKKFRTINSFLYTVLGLGILFLGMQLMKGNMTGLKDEAWFVSAIAAIDPSHWYGALLGILIGTIMTIALQSVSASVGILQAMAMVGAISLPQAMFLIAGQNIGCTIASVMAAVGGTKDAKRTACMHVSFNIIAAFLCFVVAWVIPHLAGNPNLIYNAIDRLAGGDPMFSIALANTLLKVSATVILFPAAPLLIKLSHVIIRGEDKPSGHLQLAYINKHDFGSASLAIGQVQKEVGRMYTLARDNIYLVRDAMFTAHPKESDIAVVRENEETINYLNREITEALLEINRTGMAASDANLMSQMLHVIVDFERIGDHADNIIGYVEHVREANLVFSEHATAELHEVFDHVCRIVTDAYTSMQDPSKIPLSLIEAQEQTVDDLVETMENNHVKRLEEHRCGAEVGMMYVEILTDLERVSDHALNIAQAAIKQ